MKPNLAVVNPAKSVVRNRAVVKSGKVLWPWRLTSLQRIDVQHATRAVYFDAEHLARVLDARMAGTKARKRVLKSK